MCHKWAEIFASGGFLLKNILSLDATATFVSESAVDPLDGQDSQQSHALHAIFSYTVRKADGATGAWGRTKLYELIGASSV
jgi:hypothetical protein